VRTVFDRRYYQRFYHDPKSRAVTPAAAKRQAAYIAASMRYHEMPIRRVLDLGCGVGRVLRALQKEFPKAHCDGVEYSQYLCKKYGFIEGSVVDYDAPAYDLLVCNDVLSYLDDDQCSTALSNIATLTKQAAFLGILTEEDREMCDTKRTDQHQHLRTAGWYRRRLSRHFLNIGGGFYLKKPVDVAVWTLDGGPSWSS
jgi:trans-aconitate methyltransferase